MHKKVLKVISLVLVLVFCTVFQLSCNKSSDSTADIDMEKELDKLGKLNQVTLHFVLAGAKKRDSQVVLDEVASRSNLNIKLNFEWYNQNYNEILKKLLASDVPLDAFYVGRSDSSNKTNYISLANNGSLKDITGLLPKLAPNIYTKLTDEDLSAIKIGGKIFTVPSLYPQAVCQYTAIKSDFMRKYNISPISTFEDYEMYLKTIKENEKDFIPGSAGYVDTELFARVYDYIMLDNTQSLVYKRDDPKMKIIPWEQTPEFRQIVDFFTKWHEEGYLWKPSSGIKLDFASFMGKNPVFFEGVGKFFGIDDKGNQKIYDVYYSSLYPTKPFQRLNPIGDIYSNGAMAFNSKSNNVERALMFLNWIQSSQENYDLFMYGIKGKHYDLEGERISLPEGMDMNNSTYCYWLNRPFLNTEFERISINNTMPDDFYKEYSDFIKAKTKYAPHEGFTPDYKGVHREASDRANMLSRDINFALTEGTFKAENVDTIIQKLKDTGTERIVYEVQKQLDDWVKTNK